MKKRVLAMVLAMVMVAGLLPVTALAEEGALPKLPTPTELEWNKRYAWTWISGEDPETGHYEVTDSPGCVVWTTNAPVNCTATVQVFRRCEGETEFTQVFPNHSWSSGGALRPGVVEPYGEQYVYSYLSPDDDDVTAKPIAGTYKFTVQLHAEGYQDSEVVESAEWTYVDPERAFPTPSNLTWDGKDITWEMAEDITETPIYWISVYYSPTVADATSTEEVRWVNNFDAICDANDLRFSLPEEELWLAEDRYGDGYYYVQIFAKSTDFTVINNSSLSKLSPPYHYVSGEPDDRPQLPTPTDLTWNMVWWTDENGECKSHEVQGALAWKCALPEELTWSEYRLALIGPFEGETPPEDAPCVKERIWSSWSNDYVPYFYCYGFWDGIALEGGNYVFTVQCLAEGTEWSWDYKNSEVAVSPVWHYEKPQRQLAAPGKPKMGGKTCGFLWNDEENEVYAKEHYIEFYFSADNANATSVENLELICNDSTWLKENTIGGFSHYTLINTGTGYYYCRARTLSTDIEECASSDWSPLSDAEYIEAKPMQLTEDMFTVDTTAVTYTGKPITKKVSVTEKYEYLFLDEGYHYTVEYKNNTNVGTATIVITGIGQYYTGTLEYTFTIKAKSSGGSSSNNKPKPDPKPVEPIKPVEPEKPVTPASEIYRDVVKGSWYEDGVTYVTHKGLFQGMAEGVFAPDFNMTRAMVVTVLARLDGENIEDVAAGAPWYTKAMNWGMKQGISDGTMPNDSVIREQLVTMLYRYAKSPAADGNLNGYVDKGSVSNWAKDAMVWAVSNGILTGKDGQRLDPQGTATRAEVAAVIQRFVEKLEK